MLWHKLPAILQEVYELRSRGLIKGGTIGAALIAYGSDWYEDGIVRFYDDEPARHKIVDLTVRGSAFLQLPSCLTSKHLPGLICMKQIHCFCLHYCRCGALGTPSFL